MKILGIDPGPEESAFVLWDAGHEGGWIDNFGHVANCEMLRQMCVFSDYLKPSEVCAGIEMVASYGMAVGKDVFETCVWIGRMQQHWIGLGHYPAEPIYRKDVKMHLCQSMRAKDANIRQALIDRFGKPGTKSNPGKLFGIANHLWSALAIAVTASDKMNQTNYDPRTQRTRE